MVGRQYLEQFYRIFYCTEKNKVSVLHGCLDKSVSFAFSKKLKGSREVSIKTELEQGNYYFTLQYKDLINAIKRENNIIFKDLVVTPKLNQSKRRRL